MQQLGDSVSSEHRPFPGLQVPAMWHESEAVQVTGLDPTQASFWHLSVCVHALSSLQAVPALPGL